MWDHSKQENLILQFSRVSLLQTRTCNRFSTADETGGKVCADWQLKFKDAPKLFSLLELWNLLWGAREMKSLGWHTHTRTHSKQYSSYCFISVESRKLISCLSPSNSYWMNSLWGILLKPPTHLTQKKRKKKTRMLQLCCLCLCASLTHFHFLRNRRHCRKRF